MGVNNTGDIYNAYAEGYQDGVEFAYNELKEEARAWFAPKWVSIKDRLPESGEHVLVCCETRHSKGRYVCDAFYTAHKTKTCSWDDDIDSVYDDDTDEYYMPEGWWEVIKNWDDYSCVAIEDFVLYWMSLPEMPKEEEKT